MKRLLFFAVVCAVAVLCSEFGLAQSPEYARSKKPAGYYLEVPNYYNGIRIPPGPPRTARPGYAWDRFQTQQGIQWVEKRSYARPYYPYGYRVPNYYRGYGYGSQPVIVQPVIMNPPVIVNRYFW